MQASILIVEDEADMRDTLHFTVEMEGYQTFAAADGLAALQLLRANPIDLILADVVMPCLDGYQLYARVRQEPSWLTIPFIFLSGRALDSDIRLGKSLGVDDYLIKPIQRADLLAAVRGNLRRARQLAGHRPAAPTKFNSDPLIVGSLHISLCQHRVWSNGCQVYLSAREFKLLLYLAQRANQVVSLPELVEITHQQLVDKAEAGRLLRPIIYSLRYKLGRSSGENGCIQSVRGVGYRLVPRQM